MDDKQFDNLPSADEDVIDAEFEEVVLPATQIGTALALSPSLALAIQDVNRLGCAYCFRTLNPGDPDETLRNAVRVITRYFHQKCWGKTPEADQEVEVFTPPEPQPLRVVTLVGAPLHTGTLNKIDDSPLGISESVVILDTTLMSSVALRNNSDAPLKLDRRIMPVWAYLKFAAPNTSQGHELILSPGDTVRLEIYPHVVRPGLETYRLSLTDKQGMSLESQGVSVIPIAMLIGVYGLFLWHVSALLNMRFWFHYWGSYAGVQFHFLLAPFLILSALIAILTLLSPATVLWGIYTVVKSLKASPISAVLAQPLTRLETVTLKLIDLDSLENTLTHWVMPLSLILIGIGVVGALLLWIPLLLLTTILKPLSDVFLCAELGLILYLLYRFGRGYGFNLVSFIESLVRSAISTYRASQRSQGEI